VPLGERTVNGRYDHDRIEVGRYEGRFSRLTMVVENSDLEMIDFKIVFGDRTEYHPRLSHYFREGQRTQVIELPPGESVIRFIDFQYRNLPGGGDARVQVWGFRTDGGPPPPPPPPPPSNHPSYLHALSDLRMARAFLERPSNIQIQWDENRAIREIDAAIREIKEAAIDDGKDLNDHPPVDRPTWGGRLQRALEMVVQARTDVSQEEDSPSSRVHRLRQRSLEHIANADRAIRDGIEAARALREDAPPPPPPAWDQRGWTLLGEKRVDSHREDFDRIEVARWEPRFSKLSLVVLDADMELIDLTIKFKHEEPFHPDVRQFFREGSRARLIDLPGDQRTIRWIEFRYRNLPGQGRARVQVWAR